MSENALFFVKILRIGQTYGHRPGPPLPVEPNHALSQIERLRLNSLPFEDMIANVFMTLMRGRIFVITRRFIH